MADVLQWNSSLVVLVDWSDFDAVLCASLGSGPGAAALITTHPPARPPHHFSWNPQICESPQRHFPFYHKRSEGVSQLRGTTPSISKNVHFRMSTGNERQMKKVQTAPSVFNDECLYFTKFEAIINSVIPCLLFVYFLFWSNFPDFVSLCL